MFSSLLQLLNRSEDVGRQDLNRASACVFFLGGSGNTKTPRFVPGNSRPGLGGSRSLHKPLMGGNVALGGRAP